MRIVLAILATTPVGTTPTVALFPIEVGAEFQVNTYTRGDQDWASVSSDANGNFVVAWESRAGVFAQRYESAGVPQSVEFQVNTYTIGFQLRPSVSSDVNGNFMVAWYSHDQDGYGTGVFAQRYDSAGVPQGVEFQVNTYTIRDQSAPSVSADANGNFVVAWRSYQDGDRDGVFAQRYDSAGVPQGVEFQVNTYTIKGQSAPSVSADANGNFIVAWHSYDQDGDGDGVFAQRYDSAGVRQGVEFQVNSYTIRQQGGPSVSADANGNFVVAWESNRDGNLQARVFAQRYDSTGVAQGVEFQVNTYTGNYYQRAASVSSDADGNFMVVWQSWGQDGHGSGVFAQLYDSMGVPQGAEFQANSHTPHHQRFARVSADANGTFVVAWQSYDQENYGYSSGVFAQRYTLLAPLCGAAPLGTCQTPGKSILRLKDKSSDRSDKVTWKWLKGPVAEMADFGDPTTTATYALCVYHGGSLLMEINAPRGRVCNGKPCWRQLGSGFKYKDQSPLLPNGGLQFVLKRSARKVKGAGDLLPDPGLSLTDPVTVELVNDETPVCFGDTYSGPEIIQNLPDRFKAKASNP